MAKTNMTFDEIRRNEWRLINPSRPFYAQDSEYGAFVNRLSQETDFYETRANNDKKYNKPIKGFSKSDRIVAFALAIVFAVMSGSVAADKIKTQNIAVSDKAQEKQKAKLVVLTAIAAIFGFVMGAIGSKGVRRAAREYDIEDFYNRLALYLFDNFKTAFPELTVGVLKKYNPELSQVVTELLIANMDENETKQLRAMALTVTELGLEQNINPDEYAKIIDKAIDIINNAFQRNPKLYNTVSLVFRGTLPICFDLNKNKTAATIKIFDAKDYQYY